MQLINIGFGNMVMVALGYDGASAGRAVASVPDCDRVEDMIMQALRATTK